MKLASSKKAAATARLIVVSRDLARAVRVRDIAPHVAGRARGLGATPRRGSIASTNCCTMPARRRRSTARRRSRSISAALAAPLPRAYEFVDGSAYLPHVERVRRARGAEVPESFYVDPLMYQAVSAGFYGPRDPVRVTSEDYGIDLEAEIVVVTDDVPMARDAGRGRDAHPADRPGQRRFAAQPDSRTSWPRVSASCSPSRARRCRRYSSRRTNWATPGATPRCISR